MEINLNWKTGLIIIIILMIVTTILYLNLFAKKVDEYKDKIFEVSGTVLDINENSLLVQTDKKYIVEFDKFFYVNTKDLDISVDLNDKILIKYHKSSGYPKNIEALEIEKI